MGERHETIDGVCLLAHFKVGLCLRLRKRRSALVDSLWPYPVRHDSYFGAAYRVFTVGAGGSCVDGMLGAVRGKEEAEVEQG